MEELLRKEYPSHYCAIWKKKYCIIKQETNQSSFCLSDQTSECICEEDLGVAKYINSAERNVVIINYEKYINQYGNSVNAGKGLKCDFILYTSSISHSCFILNELTWCYSKYLDKHERDGQTVSGKKDKALEQLSASINKLMAVSAIHLFVEAFSERVALFSYRLKDMPTEQEIDENDFSRSYAMFSMPQEIVAEIQGTELQQGFIFEQRIYPASFVIT